MTSNSIAARSKVYEFIHEHIDQLRQKRVLKLNNLKFVLPGIPIHDIIDYTHECLTSLDPPIDLERLCLQNNQLDALPSNLGVLAKVVRYLDLHGNNFTDLPQEAAELHHLEIIDLSKNKITHLSRSRLAGLTNLKVLSLKENRLKYLPPILGELPNLNLLEVMDNPIVIPSMETIKALQKATMDHDWVKQLKAYLVTHASTIEQKIAESSSTEKYSHSKQSSISSSNSNSNSNSNSSTPQLSRTKSISETRTKASKAARRMGLIIKKPDDVQEDHKDIDSAHSQPTPSIQDFPSPLNLQNIPTPSIETSFTPVPPVGTTTLTTVASSEKNSPPVTPTLSAANSFLHVHSQNSQAPPRPRSRSNTLIEIDRILETDSVDTEHKSGAYFRRLSTLQEVPNDDITTQSSISTPAVSVSTNNTSIPTFNGNSAMKVTEDQELKAPALVKTSPTARSNHIFESSPSKTNTKKHTESEISHTVSVSRKVLFSFSELHSSVRRFTGFCVDKKITIKMVSFLYTAKANIDGLVENLELVEENSGNVDKINESLHNCISSFKSIMGLLSENLAAFVAKIDVCFIRMLYLTIYGSFNEIFNAYKVLVPSASLRTLSVSANTEAKAKITNLSVNTSFAGQDDDVDEKLYQSIDVATSKAQDVFGELTRAISKTALSSATNAKEINNQVATKVKELTNICMSSMDIIKRLKTKLITIRNNASYTTKRLFWDDINLFLKAIIQTFSSVKGIMEDFPILNEIRSSMATLTKSTKEVTVLLEASSYKSMATDTSNPPSNYPPSLSSIPSVSNIFTPAAMHPGAHHSYSHSNLTQLASQPIRTPLAATLGPAAQAILPQNDTNHTSSTFANAPMPYDTTTFTAPPQSSGQYYARNGMNPFDGLIMAKQREQ